MTDGGWDGVLRSFLESYQSSQAAIDTRHIQTGLTTFLIRSFDGEALQFSFPLRAQRDLLSEIDLDPAGADGAAAALIERIKERAETEPKLGPLYGAGVPASERYRDTIEPYTIIHSADSLGSHLWKADGRNFCDHGGVHFLIRGALPCPGNLAEGSRRVSDTLADLSDTIGEIIEKTPVKSLESIWLASLDQKLLRQNLRAHGLVSFIGDGARLARSPTHHRCFFRVAGPKAGVNIPFCCPKELEPVELVLPQATGP